MPFTITKTDEEANDIGKVLERINREQGRTKDQAPGLLIKGHNGGRMFTQAWDDPTMHPTNFVPLGGQLIEYRDVLPEDKLTAIGDACKRGDVAALNRLLFSRLGGKDYVGVDLGFKCQGKDAVQTFMKALPEQLKGLDLNLKGNNLMVAGVKAFAEGIAKLKNLTQLQVDLSQNRAQAQGIDIFMSAIPKTVTRLTLLCGGMKMGLPGVKAIADNLPPNLTDFTVDLHDGLMGDEGCVYLSQRLPKTLEKLDIHMRGDQGWLTNRGYWMFDRLIGDPENSEGLPNLKNENFRCQRNNTRDCVQQYEVTKNTWELVQRWGPHENVC